VDEILLTAFAEHAGLAALVLVLLYLVLLSFFFASLIASRGVTGLWSGISFTAAIYSGGYELWVWQDLSPLRNCFWH
jgi:hypothetical protein